jgi:tripartite ATP-independent transporter DctM subunit
MIPPSITFVIYGLFAEQSIGKLLIAGILPGVLNAFLYVLQIIIRCKIAPYLGPVGPRFKWREKIGSLISVIPFISIVLAIVLGILFGIWTPVEASAVGVVAVFLMGVLRRRFELKQLSQALMDSVCGAASVMVLVIGALTFSSFLALTGYNEIITDAVVELGLAPFQLFLVFLLLFMALGMFLEATSIIALTVPLMMPAVETMGWDPIWFGVIMVALMEVAAVTPPVGLNLYAVKAAAPEIPTKVIFLGAIPFWLCDVTGIFVIFFVPSIALFLPGLMLG